MKFDEVQSLVQDKNFVFVRELQAMAYLALGVPELALKFQAASPKGAVLCPFLFFFFLYSYFFHRIGMVPTQKDSRISRNFKV